MTALDDRVSDPRGTGSVLMLALLYLLAACALGVWQGGTLLTLHAFAAFVTLSIVAASNQFLPVLTNAKPLRAGALLVQAAPLAVGFFLLLLGFGGVRSLAGMPCFAAAGLLLAAGAVTWAAVLVWRTATAPLEGQTRAAAGAAAVSFALAALLGGAMASALQGYLPSGLVALAPAHGMLMVVAFASTMIFAISYRFVPMFALAHTQERRFSRVAQWLVALAGWLGALAAAAESARWLAGTPAAGLRVAAALAVAAILTAGVSHLRSLRVRLRKRLDVSLRYALAAWAYALAGACAALAGTWAPALWPSAVAMAMAGWLSISILGYGYKILGFLAWEYARRRFGRSAQAPLADAVPVGPANLALALLIAGTAGIAGEVAFSPLSMQGALSRAPFVIYGMGALLATLLAARLVWDLAGPAPGAGERRPGSPLRAGTPGN